MMFGCETESSERRSPDGTEVLAVLKPGHHTSSAAAHRLADCVQCSEDKTILTLGQHLTTSQNQQLLSKLSDISMDCLDSDVNMERSDNDLEHTDLSEEIEVDSSCDLKIDGTPEHFLTIDQLHDKGWI